MDVTSSQVKKYHEDELYLTKIKGFLDQTCTQNIDCEYDFSKQHINSMDELLELSGDYLCEHCNQKINSLRPKIDDNE